MNIRIENIEGSMVLWLNGRFDADISLDLGDRIDFEISARAGAGPIDFDVIVDMEKVPYISSGGIRVLLSVHRKMQSAGHRLGICGLQPAVARVMGVTGLFGFFDIYPSVKDAKKRIRKEALEAGMRKQSRGG